MAIALPEGRRGQALALGLTALVLVAAWLAVVQPLLDTYNEASDELGRRTALATRMTELAALLPELQRAAKSQTTAVAPAAATLEGVSDSVAAASLQGLVEAMATSTGAHLTSTEALPAEQVNAYRRISLRLTVDATWPVLIKLLQQIERGTPRMFVDELQIHAQPAAEKLREPPLDISFLVLAFRAATAAEAKAPAALPAAGTAP